ncbi:hypothetical protein UMM65_01230 [Aureibaculum sp. 2210JD6-5]|uniref:hypothetical protein n=1 Tax=Aureibaculum sp. 2210JD6-5 TaxID=3103957 RepID=UPI002AAE7524|nr:hypothetical protein [Aureibaculum sp. 2210JD6-5]MDY7393853.1 hypothetical protein [Aureibaculum sp. 2210JD6-5]
MSKYIFIIFTIVLFSCNPKEKTTSKDQKVTTTPENTKETLKAVVEGETYAYMEKDYKKWASYWDHGNDVLRLDIANGSFSQTRGWANNGGNLESYFKENPEPITSTFKNSNYLIFHDENLAWVAFDQTWTSQSGEKSVAKATITLVKKENDWKIISYTAIQYEAEDANANTLGRE